MLTQLQNLEIKYSMCYQTKDNFVLKDGTSQWLHYSIEQVLINYFYKLGDAMPTNFYQSILAEIEEPLLKVIMIKTSGNETRAAGLLGINRGTLRNKLKQYHIYSRKYHSLNFGN